MDGSRCSGFRPVPGSHSWSLPSPTFRSESPLSPRRFPTQTWREFPESELLSRAARRSLIAVAGGEADETVSELLANRDFEAFTNLYARLPDHVRACITRLSPLTVAGEVQAPVELIVPPRDEYFPHGEALALAKALPDARLTVTGALDHTRPSARLRGLIRFLGFVARGLRRAGN